MISAIIGTGSKGHVSGSTRISKDFAGVETFHAWETA